MNRRDAAGLACVVIVYFVILTALWLRNKREKDRIRREKLTGQLPVRQSPLPPASMSPVFTAVSVVLVLFCPIFMWLFVGLAVQLLTPPTARVYLPPHPPLSRALHWNVNWWLFCGGLALCVWVLDTLGKWVTKRFADTVVSRAKELIEIGNLDEAVDELNRAIDASGPSFARWNTLADALIKQERWLEALRISFDFADRYPLNSENRRRRNLLFCKLGLPEIALSLQDRSSATTNQKLSGICTYCQALIDLGLMDKAWDQLRRAEVIFSRNRLSEEETSHLRKQIDGCRVRLVEHFPEKKTNGLEEL